MNDGQLLKNVREWCEYFTVSPPTDEELASAFSDPRVLEAIETAVLAARDSRPCEMCGGEVEAARGTICRDCAAVMIAEIEADQVAAFEREALNFPADALLNVEAL